MLELCVVGIFVIMRKYQYSHQKNPSYITNIAHDATFCILIFSIEKKILKECARKFNEISLVQ